MSAGAAGAAGGDPRGTVMWTEGAELDEPMLKLILGAILLGREASAGFEPSAPPFRPDGRLIFPGGKGSLGEGDPFLAYCALLWVGTQTLGEAPVGDLETSLMLMIRLTPEWRAALHRRYRELLEETRFGKQVPGLHGMALRPGWERGFENGFMNDVKSVFDGDAGEANFDARLLGLLTGLQMDIDKACDILEGDKLRLARERLQGILG
jgi:hypothetical protein